MKLFLRIVIPFLVLGGAGYVTYLLIESRPAPLIREAEAVLPLVETMNATLERVQLRVGAEGTVRPTTVTELVPEVAGRVVEVSPSLVVGGFFEEGDVLLRLEPREYELALTRARAAIAQANLRLETERQEARVAEREFELLDVGPLTALALREPQIAEAQAALASAEASLEQAQYDLERTVIRAPYAGRVETERVDFGQFVQRGTSVATLYSVDAAEIRLPIPDVELQYLDLPLGYRNRDNSTANLPRVIIRARFAGEQFEWDGRIVRTEGIIDPETRQVHAIARVEDPYAAGADPDRPPLAVGMFVEAEILGHTSAPVAVLPRTALRGGNTVLVVDENNRLRFRDVVVFREERERVLLSAGVGVGDRIVRSPLENAVDGMQVRTPESEASAVFDTPTRDTTTAGEDASPGTRPTD